MFGKLLRDISWLGFSNALVKPFWFLFVTAACMRVLGTENYGIMMAALSLSMIATSFTDLGMGRYMVREVARDRMQAGAFFTNFMLLRLVLVLLAGALTFASSVLLGYRGPALLAVAFACVYTLSLELSNFGRGMFQAFEDLRSEAILLLVEKALVIGGGMTLLLATQTAYGTLAGMSLGVVITAVFSTFWIARTKAPLRRTLLDGAFIRRSLWSMLPLGLAGMFANIYFRVDLVMIEAMRGEVSAGQYGAAYRILEALNLLPTIISYAAIFPRLSRLHHERDYASYWRLLQFGLVGIGSLSLLIAVALTAFGPALIRLLDPHPQFGPAGPALQILCWAFPFFCINSLLYLSLATLNDERFAAFSLGGAVVLNVALNSFLIPALGINGAAIATIIPEVMLTVLYAVRFRNRSHDEADAPISVRQGDESAPYEAVVP